MAALVVGLRRSLRRLRRCLCCGCHFHARSLLAWCIHPIADGRLSMRLRDMCVKCLVFLYSPTIRADNGLDHDHPQLQLLVLRRVPPGSYLGLNSAWNMDVQERSEKTEGSAIYVF